MDKRLKSALPPAFAGEDSSSAPEHCKSASSTPAAGRAQGKMHCKRRGEVAEAAFLHKAASLGFSVAKPWGDSDRYDFILDNGGRSWRVQIKTASAVGKGAFGIHACGSDPTRVYTAEEIDFLVAYIVSVDLWYVLPVQLFATVRHVKLFPFRERPVSRYEKYRETWCLMACPKDGICKAEIDIQHCCQRGSVRDESVCPKGR